MDKHKIKTLQDEVRSANTALKSLHEERKGKEWREEDDIKFNKMFEEKRSKEKEIDRLQKLMDIEKEQAREALETAETRGENVTSSKEKQIQETRAALKRYWQVGKFGLNADERSILFGQGHGILLPGEKRNQSAVIANLGAEMVREEYLNEYEKHMISASGLLENVRIIRTATGGDLPYPTVNDTTNKGRLLSENTASTKTNIATNEIVFKAYKYSSDHVLVPNELMQDDGYSFVNDIPQILAERNGRIINEHGTTGDNSSKPQGITVGAGDSTIEFTANTVTRTKLLDLIHSVNSAYRKGAKFMFNDDTLARIIKLSIGSSDDRPLWLPSMRDGAPESIEGYGYAINDDMPNMATTGNKALIFGDLNKFAVRLVRDFHVLITAENGRHVDTDQIGFYGFMRADARIINADAIKYADIAA